MILKFHIKKCAIYLPLPSRALALNKFKTIIITIIIIMMIVIKIIMTQVETKRPLKPIATSIVKTNHNFGHFFTALLLKLTRKLQFLP